MDHDPLLLGRDGAATALLHDIEGPLAVLDLTGVVPVLVHGEVGVVEEARGAELAHERSADDRRVRELS
eukprot:13500733-Heterocapsa_arctica.AAC.1